jgi:succinate dehydrogenase/fumarate reductase cytochrome b subunit
LHRADGTTEITTATNITGARLKIILHRAAGAMITIAWEEPVKQATIIDALTDGKTMTDIAEMVIAMKNPSIGKVGMIGIITVAGHGYGLFYTSGITTGETGTDYTFQISTYRGRVTFEYARPLFKKTNM